MAASPKFMVSSRATKGGPTQQVTIPAAIARKLPQGVSIRWEVSLVKGGLYFKYLGPNAEVDSNPEIVLDFVPASDLKATDEPKKKAPPKAPVEETAVAPEETSPETPENQPETPENVPDDDDSAPF